MTALIKRVKDFSEMIKFEHTIFALPFAYMAAFLAYGGFPTLTQMFWITLAMVGARTAAMSLNRLIDRHIDAKNPRTANRALPKGLLSVSEVWIYVMLSWLLLLVAALKLNPLDQPIPLTVKLMPLVVFVLTIYSYTKRFTWACHLVLGLALGLAPVGSWVGITGSLGLPAILLGLAVMTWTAGFDVVYACQDYEFDKDEGLHSIPSTFGIKTSLIIARVLHVLAVIFLVLTGYVLSMGYLYWIGVIVAAGILIYEHSLVSANDLSKLDVAFFNMNGILSVLVFLFTLADIILGFKISV